MVMRNISVFCLQRIALYFKVMPTSIDFCKGIFLHVIPVRIIVPCSLLGTLGASLLGSMLAGKRVIRGGDGLFEQV